MLCDAHLESKRKIGSVVSKEEQVLHALSLNINNIYLDVRAKTG